MGRINGVVVGIVQSLEDPKNLGRIEVQFPWLSDQNKSYWARVATFMSGSRRGSWFMPELGDEVLVAFEHGCVQHPYVVGFLWNGKDKPPNDAPTIDSKVRRLRTVSGHVVEFDDRPGQERILIQTKGGHKIEMNDTPGNIHIETAQGQKVDLDTAGITIFTSGTLTINCLTANVTASSMLNVSAPMTVFSGVVQIPTLIAQAVIGSSYTPAPGNTFGL